MTDLFLRAHRWLHDAERRGRVKAIVSLGCFASALLAIVDPAFAVHATLAGLVTNLIWIWE